MYQVILSKDFQKQFKKLDKSIQRIIAQWVRTNLFSCENPRSHGKALKANLSGYWRYRVADYRIIVEIKDTELIIIAISVAHRKNVYK